MSGSVTFTPTIDEYVAANHLQARYQKQRRWLRWLAIGALGLAALNVAFQTWTGASPWRALSDSAAMLIFGAVMIAVPLTDRVLFPRLVKRQFAQRPSLAETIEAHWDDEKIVMTASNGHSIQPWRTLHRWVADDRSIILLPTDRTMQLIPTRALTAEQDADLRETLRRAGPSLG